MTASEIRASHQEFTAQMSGLERDMMQAALKNSSKLSSIMAGYTSAIQLKTLESWTEIAAQLAESNQIKREHFEETKRLCAELIAAYKATIGQDASLLQDLVRGR